MDHKKGITSELHPVSLDFIKFYFFIYILTNLCGDEIGISFDTTEKNVMLSQALTKLPGGMYMTNRTIQPGEVSNIFVKVKRSISPLVVKNMKYYFQFLGFIDDNASDAEIAALDKIGIEVKTTPKVVSMVSASINTRSLMFN